ncbi:unnamed protein product, partial [Prorocentrum cordatum]
GGGRARGGSGGGRAGWVRRARANSRRPPLLRGLASGAPARRAGPLAAGAMGCVSCLSRSWLSISSAILVLAAIASLTIGIIIGSNKAQDVHSMLEEFAWATKLLIALGVGLLIIGSLGLLGSTRHGASLQFRRCVLFPFFFANLIMLVLFVSVTTGARTANKDTIEAKLEMQCLKDNNHLREALHCEQDEDGDWHVPDELLSYLDYLHWVSVAGFGISGLLMVNLTASFLAATARNADGDDDDSVELADRPFNGMARAAV